MTQLRERLRLRQGGSRRSRPALIDVVVLGGPPYQVGANQTSLQTFSELSRQLSVLYVCRRFQESTLRRMLSKKNASTASSLNYGFHVLSSSAYVLVLPRIFDWLPFVRPEFGRRVLIWLLGRQLRAILGEELSAGHGVSLITYWWMFPELVKQFSWEQTVFEVIDRHWGYSHLRSDVTKKRNYDLSVRTGQLADQVTCVSDALSEELQQDSISSVVLPNGVDLRRVADSVSLDGERSNTAVYVGGWNSRIDFSLLFQIVEKNPNWKFKFIGGETDPSFSRFSNVQFFGDLPYETVLQHLAASKVGLLPFKTDDYTNASSFLKVLDYLACGLTVGATDVKSLQEVREQYGDKVTILRNISDWSNFLRRQADQKEFPSMPPDFLKYSVERRINKLVPKKMRGH
jgi:glycosyltransferase involved in cell wall biosynthesis